MALQTPNLIMAGLGCLRDAPPNSEQPPLTDAIHLRWAFKRELGFPWFGFYLFRRVHRRGNLSWLSQHTGQLQKGTWTSTTFDTPFGRVSSDARLVLTEDFRPSTSVEFDLADRGFLRVIFPEQASARHVETRIGFRARPGDPPPLKRSLSFTGRSVSRGPNPRTENDVVFETRDRSDRLRPNTFIRSVPTSSGPITGLGCKFKLNITLPQPATFVEVTLTGAARRDRPEGTPTIEAYNQDGTRADGGAMRDPGNHQPETFLLTGTAITRVLIDERQPEAQQDDDQDRVILNDLSFGTATVSEVHLTAFAGATPVHRVNLRGYGGSTVSMKIEFEGISAIELSSAPAALIDLGTVPLAEDATAGWERLKDFPYPMRLPITHPDYPCTPQMSEDFTRSRQLAADRIQYGSSQQFTSAPNPIPNTGTISVRNGSPIVVGAGTKWNNELLDAVVQVSGDNSVYTVAMVVSPAKLILSRPYSGASRTGAQYTISRDSYGQFYSYLASLVAGGRAAGSMVSRTMPEAITTAGTVSVTKDSTTVAGNGTAWSTNLAGLDFQLDGEEAVYTIAAVDSFTQLTLARPYAGESESSKSYRIGARLSSVAVGEVAPRMPAQSPLDMVLIGSLHPAIAQMSGLYWSDRSADVDQTYDYLIVGDYTGVAELNPDKMLANIGENGFSSTDGSIVYNMRIAPALPLAGPDGLEVFALPGSSRRTESGTAEESVNNVGVRWNLNKTELGVLLPGRAVMYHLWRANLGNGNTPATSARYELLSRQSPVLVTGTGIPPQPAPDWPPFSLHAIDNALAEGWYGYQVSGIDIFGRHSANSAAGAWRQWFPVPDPRPWYYVDPPSDVTIHPSAVRLLTKIAPPPPTSVEAFALDPADPTLIKDAAYTAWWNKLQNKNVIGLRVRWVWPNAHLIQAPHTREFRIYYQPDHLNALLGKIQAVIDSGSGESDVTTDIPNSEPAGSYVGASLHAGEDAFVIVGSEADSPLRVRVRNVGPRRTIIPQNNVPCTIAIPPIDSAGTPHPRFIDYSKPVNWERRYHVVSLEQHWTAATDTTGQPIRLYEIFLPVPEDTTQEALPLNPSRSEPIVYANIGVTAADDRSHTRDDPKWTGPWAGRPGNEGRVGPPAKIFRVLREPPQTPSLPRMPERVFATRADQNGISFYTFRWQPLPQTTTHIFRTFDDALFKIDWTLRPRAALDATQVDFFPKETIDGRWPREKRQQVATELNQLNIFAHDAAGTALAFTYYRGLSADALRTLAGLTGNEAAFIQITTAPLEPSDPACANRRGPDDPDNFQIGDPVNPLASSDLRVFIDALDGRTTNRYLYRAINIDAAHNRSPFSLAGAPVHVHDVIAPERPLFLEALGGNRTITLHWLANLQHDLAHYLLYRTDSVNAAERPGTMVLHQRIEKNQTSPVLQFVDTVTPRITFYYRLIAVDVSGNSSEPSDLVASQAYQLPPDSPLLSPPVWDAIRQKVTLTWTASDPNLESRVERRVHGRAIWVAATGWLPVGNYRHQDEPPQPNVAFEYRVRTRDALGQVSIPSSPEVTS